MTSINRKYGRLVNGVLIYAPKTLTLFGKFYNHPNESHYRAAGWLPVYDILPKEPPPEGYHYEAQGWETDGVTIRRKYALVANPPPAPRTFSKLKLYAAIAQAGLWDALETWLKEQTVDGINAFTAFSLAQDISEAHPLFEPWYTAAKSILGVTDEQGEAILAASVAEGV